jgi:hypothetical protein
MSSTPIPLDSGDFCVMTARVKDNMLRFQEQNPFLRGIRAWVVFVRQELNMNACSELKANQDIPGKNFSSLQQTEFSPFPIFRYVLSGF